MTTIFNPEHKEILTYGECLDPAMGITDQEDADQYLKAYIAYTQAHLDKSPRKDAMTAQEIAKINLGYYAGYYNTETRERVERLFKCYHPIFGKVKEHVPTAEEAFTAGKSLGQKEYKAVQ